MKKFDTTFRLRKISVDGITGIMKSTGESGRDLKHTAWDDVLKKLDRREKK